MGYMPCGIPIVSDCQNDGNVDRTGATYCERHAVAHLSKGCMTTEDTNAKIADLETRLRAAHVRVEEIAAGRLRDDTARIKAERALTEKLRAAEEELAMIRLAVTGRVVGGEIVRRGPTAELVAVRVLAAEDKLRAAEEALRVAETQLASHEVGLEGECLTCGSMASFGGHDDDCAYGDALAKVRAALPAETKGGESGPDRLGP